MVGVRLIAVNRSARRAFMVSEHLVRARLRPAVHGVGVEFGYTVVLIKVGSTESDLLAKWESVVIISHYAFSIK